MTTQNTDQGPLLIYCLNAPVEKDLEFRDAIRQHLKPIIRKFGESGVPLEVVNDEPTLASTEIEAHRRRLGDAQIVLALLSSAFIDDDDIYDRSLPVLARAGAGELVMISILVRNFNWKDTPFAGGVVLPENERPLNSWVDKDDAVTAVVKEVGDAIKTIAGRLARPTVASPVAATMAPPSGEPAGSNSAAADPADAGPTALVRPTSAWAPPKVQQPDPSGRVHAAFAPPVPAQARASGAGSTASTSDKPLVVAVDWRKRYYRRVLWKRGLALMLDYTFLFLVPALVVGIVAAVLNAGQKTLDHALNVVVSVAILAFYLIAPAFEASRWRATPGKRILKMQIANKDGDRISYWRAFMRNILRSVVLYSYVFIVPLVVQFFRFRKTRKLFHDEITRTEIGERVPH